MLQHVRLLWQYIPVLHPHKECAQIGSCKEVGVYGMSLLGHVSWSWIVSLTTLLCGGNFLFLSSKHFAVPKISTWDRYCH